MHVVTMVLAAVAVMVSLAMVVVGQGRGQPASPRRQRRSARWSSPMCAAIFACMVAQDLIANHVSFGTFLVGGCGLVMLVLWWWKLGSPEQFSDAEAAANYATDRQHCGQCEYDLTGNQSGVCPECGWRIPQQFPIVDDRELWTVWWRPWRIEHLRNWRKTLWETVLFTVMFAGGSALVTFLGNPLGGVVLGLLGLVFLVHVGRVVAYGRRDNRR